jgi:tagatose 1,6-diphosphate aldolase GatY/KbaY
VIVGFGELVQERRRAGGALGAFTCYDLETAHGVLSAAAELDTAVVLLVGSAPFAAAGGAELVAALRAAAAQSRARACVQLDHVGEPALMEAAFAAGVGAVMADGSKLAFEDNVALVSRAVALARRFDGTVEAELGHVSGDEDVARAAAAGKLTDPDTVGAFLERTGADCLAVSIGNVHGNYAAPPALDWARLDAIRRATDVPLSLHGGSGLADDDMRRAVAAGIAKVNVNTELRQAYLDATEHAMADVRDGTNVLALHRRQSDAVKLVAAAKLTLYEQEKR